MWTHVWSMLVCLAKEQRRSCVGPGVAQTWERWLLEADLLLMHDQHVLTLTLVMFTQV